MSLDCASYVARATFAPMTDFEVGFVMGLIVGEGSFTGDGKTYAMEIKMHANDPEPIQYVQRVLGGTIYGPYTRNKREFWHYLLRGFEMRKHIRLFYQHLPESRKRRQFLKWAEKYNLAFWEAEIQRI